MKVRITNYRIIKKHEGHEKNLNTRFRALRAFVIQIYFSRKLIILKV